MEGKFNGKICALFAISGGCFLCLHEFSGGQDMLFRYPQFVCHLPGKKIMGSFANKRPPFSVKERFKFPVRDDKFPLPVFGENNGRRVVQKCLQKCLALPQLLFGQPSLGNIMNH